MVIAIINANVPLVGYPKLRSQIVTFFYHLLFFSWGMSVKWEDTCLDGVTKRGPLICLSEGTKILAVASDL